MISRSILTVMDSIDFKSEYNFGLSRNAGKRDKGGSGVDFTQEIFNAFLAGRTAITNQGSVTEISAHTTSRRKRYGESYRRNGGTLHKRYAQ